MLSEELLDQLDLLDRGRTRSSLHLLSEGQKRKADPVEDSVEISSDGRLVIRDEDWRPAAAEKRQADDVAAKISTRDSGRLERKRQKTEKAKESAGWAYSGGEYGSRKGRGDMKVKDKLEPYAYWPLDRKLLNRREELKAAARKGMAKVMKRKGGAAKGVTLPRAQRMAAFKAKAQLRHKKKKHGSH